MDLHVLLNSADIYILQDSGILENKIFQDWTRIASDQLMGHSIGILREMKCLHWRVKQTWMQNREPWRGSYWAYATIFRVMQFI
jgi:hypothetical protein